MNPYEVLEISVGASADEIKVAYHTMAKKWHPDRFTGLAKAEAEQRFRQLAEAYSMLKDVAPRREAAAPPFSVPLPPRPAPPKPATPARPDPGPQAQPVAGKTVDDWFKDAQAAAEAKATEKALGLVQYVIRLDGQRAEFHALFGKLLSGTNGDKRTQVRALEAAIRLNPKDVDSAILLAQTFQALGMHARASKLWGQVRNLSPNHPIFAAPGNPPGKREPDRTAPVSEQLGALAAGALQAVSRIFKRG